MKTIGQFLKEARTAGNISLTEIEEKTKIRRAFLEALENEQWERLPELPVTLGFVRSVADSLGIDSSHAAALLRRDYPPKSLEINPKPDVTEKFSWNPRLTFFVGIAVSLLAVGLYLLFQYRNFVSPPKLVVETPRDQEVITQMTVGVAGQTDPDVSVSVNDQPALIDEFGNFYTEISINKETSTIEIKAKSRSGRETIVVRTVEVKLE